MSHGRIRSFLTGAMVGAGLGILLAPREGSETRNQLKNSFNTLVDTIKDIDIEETKAALLHKVREIKDELANIDETTAKEVAEEKIKIVEEKCDDTIKASQENTAPIVEKAATEVKKNVTEVLQEFVTEVDEKVKEEKEEKKVKPTSSSKKKATSKKKTTKSKKQS